MKAADNFHCYLCGSSSCITRPGKVRDNPSLVPLECTECGLVSLSSFDHIAQGFYEESRMHANTPCAPDIVAQVGHEDNARRYENFLDFLVDKSVLDIGCGSGSFLALAKTVAARVAGVEPDKQWRPRYEALNLDVVSNLSDLRVGDIFDTICMFHVLEHIPDPLPFLRHMKNFLAPDGRVIIEVPSAQDALLTLYENPAFSEFTYWSPHLFLHTPETLEKLLLLAGYRQLETGQFQRYPLANHLYWLAKGKPAGQKYWPELNKSTLNHAYADALAALGKCDTLIGIFTG